MNNGDTDYCTSRPTGAAFCWLLFLGPFFFTMYCTANWLTSFRQDVGSYAFDWEQYVPFLPVMIIPYMSTDAMFAGSLFLCRTRVELRQLAFRFVLAISISTFCFLLFPLRFSFPRPAVDGILGALFDALTSFDQPFNQAPSLHISLLVLQWMIYARHTSGWLKRVIHVWCVLIGLSTMLTYQHHIVDLYTGVMVAMMAYFVFPERGIEAAPLRASTTVVTRPSIIRHDLVAYYACGGMMFFAVAWWQWDLFHFLLWPAAALTVIAIAYAGVGTAIFLKFEGRLSLCSRIALAPYLLGAYISYRFYTRTGPAYVSVIPRLWIGKRLSKIQAEEAIRAGITAVVDLTAEFDEAGPLLNIPYYNLQTMDLTPLSPDELDRVVSFVRTHIRTGIVLVHCALGYARSAEVIAAYLLAEQQVNSVKEAEEIIRRSRPQIVLSSWSRETLESYQHKLHPLLEKRLAS